jgi:alkylation response protein AidB-like acyl-CoA dehydrogenase
MDFSYTEDQQAIIDLAAKILTDRCTHERLKAIERGGGPRFDRELWQQVADAGLLGVPIPAEYGGAGLGFLEACAIVEQVGRRTAPIPYLETVVLGALPLAAFGSPAQQQAWLPRVAAGECVLTAALAEEGPTRALPAGSGWTLDGEKICVPAGQLAERVLVPAATVTGEVVVFLVDPKAAGVAVEPLDTTSGQPEARLVLKGVRVADGDRLAGGGEIVGWTVERATTALCALALGVCDEALKLTAEYTKTRKQFDQPIAMFQAVSHRIADAYVDTEAIRLTCWQAAWRIGAGLPAASQVAVAKYWAADGGQRVVHAAQHLHGGIGVDRDYPLHRYFLYAKQLELTLGGATHHLRALGRLIAAA